MFYILGVLTPRLFSFKIKLFFQAIPMEIKLCEIEYDWNHSKFLVDPFSMPHQPKTVETALALWHEVEDVGNLADFTFKESLKIQAKILSMKISESEKNDFSQMVEFIWRQLYDFMPLLPLEFCKKNRWLLLKEKICWTPQGTIDKKTTFEALADVSDLPVEIRFQIAIKFCLEDRVNALAILMPANYLQKNKEWLPYVAGMDGIPYTKEHFDIRRNRSALKLFEIMMKSRNDLGSQYYWNRLSRKDETEVLKWKHLNIRLIFTNYLNRIQKRVLLRSELCGCLLVTSFLYFEWLHVFEACAKEILKRFVKKADLVVRYPLNISVGLIEQYIGYKKKYIQISAMLLEFVFKEYPTNTLSNDSNKKIINAMCILIQNGKVEFIKDFLKSVNKEWIELQFANCHNDMSDLMMIALDYGIYNHVISLMQMRQLTMYNSLQ